MPSQWRGAAPWWRLWRHGRTWPPSSQIGPSRSTWSARQLEPPRRPGWRLQRSSGTSPGSTRPRCGPRATQARARPWPTPTQAYTGSTPRSSPTTGAGTGAQPITTTAGGTLSTPTSAATGPTPVASVRPSPAMIAATALTPQAPLSVTMALEIRSVSRRGQRGSPAATWTRASGARAPTSSACSSSWPPRT